VTGNQGITLACFGLIGTLVTDEGIVELAFAEAIATQGVVSGTSAFARAMAQVHRGRGQRPADVLRTVFPENVAQAQAALLTFERSLAGALARSNATPIPGAAEVLGKLANSGCRLAVTTILPRHELTAMLHGLGWRDVFTVALTADDVPRGYPSPDLALAATLRAGVGGVGELAIVHGTAAGVECGRRAGARIVAGVLTGPHPAPRLRAAGATHVLASIADLPHVLVEAGPAGAADRPGVAIEAGAGGLPEVPVEAGAGRARVAARRAGGHPRAAEQRAGSRPGVGEPSTPAQRGRAPEPADPASISIPPQVTAEPRTLGR
jgi:phosphoglycolate phosphatase